MDQGPVVMYRTARTIIKATEATSRTGDTAIMRATKETKGTKDTIKAIAQATAKTTLIDSEIPATIKATKATTPKVTVAVNTEVIMPVKVIRRIKDPDTSKIKGLDISRIKDIILKVQGIDRAVTSPTQGPIEGIKTIRVGGGVKFVSVGDTFI